MTNSQQVSKIYRSVIEDVIKNAREYFLNEGVDEQVLQELKQIWESKLLQSRAVDGISGETQQVQRPAQYMYPHTAATSQQQLAPVPNLQQQQQQQLQQSHQQHQPHQQQQRQQQHVNTLTIAPSQINITPQGQQGLPAVRVPDRVTAQQANSGQTAILFPSQGTSHAHATHAHAIPDMTPAAAAATMAAIPGMQQVRAAPAGIQYPSNINYPHVKTIQTTQQVQQLHHQQVRTSQDPNSQPHIIQVDGVGDSDSDDDDDEDGDESNDRALEGLEGEGELEEEDPLNSEDDVSDEDPTDLFDIDNVVVCQFDKIARSRNKWKFHLKDGIMNLRGKDFVFQKAIGEAEW